MIGNIRISKMPPPPVKANCLELRIDQRTYHRLKRITRMLGICSEMEFALSALLSVLGKAEREAGVDADDDFIESMFSDFSRAERQPQDVVPGTKASKITPKEKRDDGKGR